MKYHQLSNCYVEAKTKEYQNRRFLLQQHLGSGSEGAAYLANAENWGNNPQQVVIKIQKNMKANERDFLIKLIQYQNQYENGNNLQYQPSQLIKIYDFFEWKENQCIIMEVGQENLYEYIGNKMDLSMEQRVKICFQICQPIYFLHSQKLVHRDIKPENYSKVGDIFKLIDFGLIRGSISDNKTQQVSSAIFQAPEILENSSSYTEKVDIWSLGCVFYEILSTQPLFDVSSDQYKESQKLAIYYQQQNQKLKNFIRCQGNFNQNDLVSRSCSTYNRMGLFTIPTILQKQRPEFSSQSITNRYTWFPQIQCNPQPSNQILPSSQISIQNSLPNQPPQDNQKITLEQIFSKLNLLENQVKEKDNQIQALSQNLENIVYLQQVEKDNQKQQLQRNLDEQNKQNLNQIDSLKQQVNQEKLNQNIILEEKLKQFEQQITAQQTKIQEIDKRSLSKSDLNFQNQKVVTEQQNLKSKQEDKYKLELTKAISEQETKYKVELKTVIQEQEDKYKEALKKEISEQNFQIQKIFNIQHVEIKQNFDEQLNSLNQKQLCQIEPYSKIEQGKLIMEIKTIVDEREYYKIKVNSLSQKIQLIEQEFNKEKLQLTESNNVIENSNKDVTEQLFDLQNKLEKQYAIFGLQTIQIKQYEESSIKENKSLKQKLENLQKQTQEVKLRQSKEDDELHKTINDLKEKHKEQNLKISTQNQTLQEFQQQIQSLQNQLNQAKLPLNQVKALTYFFRKTQNIKEFSNNNSKEISELQTSIKDSC
ncbi:unnamed protein product (macronuclear) [Paramecium tetraurelia]|uniref:Protein kinase domain-containing protein n=1 Tax=Paramecium tetraurelia TaxID=5888 RepID=A0CQY0_PARTE|nr:uncharacterized protein GSPATT00038853001 [Paramecium tetraurelia]CAK73197.1 unnamed protein product [Paramecium tetraurelia]|eukprot:XP_001440594.1 hypothetical protein (macronuclear) [Paramecium tetraurelia strain d4-2]